VNERVKGEDRFLAIFRAGSLVLVIVVAVLIFGGTIPKLARNLGSAKTEFEKGLKDGKNSNATTL